MKPSYLAITLALGVCIGLLVSKYFSGKSSEDGTNAGEGAGQSSSLSGADPASAPDREPSSTVSSPSNPSDRLSALIPGDKTAADTESTATSFREMMAKLFQGEASEDEQLKFWEEARTGSHLTEVIAELEKVVGEDSEEISARMNLAQAYTVKLLGVPSGPEKGIYAAKAEQLWRDVLELEPDHYEAQFSIATSLSRYPAFLNRTGDAIAEFEKAIVIQEQPGSEIENPNAYLELHRLQLRDSDPAGALQTLERAVQRHPDHEEIGVQLEKLNSSFVFETEGDENAEPVE